MEIKIKEGEKIHRVKIDGKDNSFSVSLSGHQNSISTDEISSNSFLFKMGEKVLPVYYAIEGAKVHIYIKGEIYTFEKEEGKGREVPHEEKGDREITSPLPGTITKIHVKEGEEVEKNQPLLVIESMKMENVMVSPIKGIVSKINVSEGELIDGNITVMEIKAS